MRKGATILRRGRRSVRRVLAVVSAVLLIAILARPAAFALSAEAEEQLLSAAAGDLERSLSAELPGQPLAVETKAGFEKKRHEAALVAWTASGVMTELSLGGAGRCFGDGLIRPPPLAVLAQFSTGPPEFSR